MPPLKRRQIPTKEVHSSTDSILHSPLQHRDVGLCILQALCVVPAEKYDLMRSTDVLEETPLVLGVKRGDVRSGEAAKQFRVKMGVRG